MPLESTHVTTLSTSSERPASGRVCEHVIVSPHEDDAFATHAPLTAPLADRIVDTMVIPITRFDKDELVRVDRLSSSNPVTVVALDVELPPCVHPMELDPGTLEVVAAMVRAVDYVVFRSTQPHHPLFDPYWLKTDGGIPPGKLLVDWTGPVSTAIAREHALAGSFARTQLDSIWIRGTLPRRALWINRSVLDGRRLRLLDPLGCREFMGRNRRLEDARGAREALLEQARSRSQRPGVVGTKTRSLARRGALRRRRDVGSRRNVERV